MKKNFNILNIANNWTHFWAGSLDTHNLTNPDYVRKHPAIIDHEMSEFDKVQYAIMRSKLLEKYDCYIDKKNYIRGEKHTECWNALQEMRADLTVKSLGEKDIFTKEQVNQIFNMVMDEAAKLSKKYDCPFKGFRFATNGGRSVNPNSASICTLEFLMKKKSETFTDMIKRCTKQFGFYIFCYSTHSAIKEWHSEHGRNWESFIKWWNIESTSINECCDPMSIFAA